MKQLTEAQIIEKILKGEPVEPMNEAADDYRAGVAMAIRFLQKSIDALNKTIPIAKIAVKKEKGFHFRETEAGGALGLMYMTRDKLVTELQGLKEIAA
jgi:hypothetical protein